MPWVGPTVALKSINHSSITVQWQPLSEREFGSVAKGYRIFYSKHGSSYWNNLTVNASQVEAVISGLTSYTNYTVTVAGISSIGEGLWSSLSVLTPG